MLKKIVSIILCLLALSSLCACKNDNKQTEPPIEYAKYDASAYIVDSWKETEGDTTKYVTSIMLYSEDFYDCPDVNDVKILTDNGYEPLVDAIENSEIVVYTMNESLKKGIYTHMKITTPQLLDTKKIFVELEGPMKYQENVQTREEYQETNGSLDGWAELLAQLSNYNRPSIQSRHALIDSLNYGVIELINQERDQFYYASIGEKPIIDGDKLIARFFVDAVTNSDMAQIPNQIIRDGEVANIVNGEIVISTIDKRIEIYSCIDNGELLVGFKTVDGSDFSKYDGDVPDAIVYSEIEGCACCFVVN